MSTSNQATCDHIAGPATGRPSAFAWHGWRLRLPAGWNPIKLEGDYDQGLALIADMDRPQLGVRWRTVARKRFDAARWAGRALRDEVGALAAGEATAPAALHPQLWDAGLIFLEPQPPGRDVFVAQSLVSRRVVEIVRHARRRERMLAELILPTLADSPLDGPTTWSIFDLNCVVPAGFRLSAHRLNAGDLSLTFARGRELLTVRQIALAQMALRRLPIEKWLAQHERAAERCYKPAREIEAVSIDSLQGVRRFATRRRRFGLLRRLPPRIVNSALYDATRDRLVLLQASDQSTLEEVARSVGG